MNLRLAIPMFVAAILATSLPACAWETSIEGPDVFGKTKVIATEGFGAESLVVQCDSEADLFLAFIFKKKEFEEIPEIPAKLFLKVSDEAPLQLDATLKSWNDNFAGVVSSGRDTELIHALDGLGKAKSKIDVGFEVLGQRESKSFSSRKSSKAMASVFEKCKLERPK